MEEIGVLQDNRKNRESYITPSCLESSCVHSFRYFIRYQI